LVRGKFCELLSCVPKWGDRGPSLFLTGLFSQIDAIIGRPLPEVLAELPLKKEITDAITGHGPLRIALDLIEAFEQGNWSEISRLAAQIEIEEPQLQDIYFRAAGWPGLLEMAR
jgi:c-di-GMP phosphodiesterase